MRYMVVLGAIWVMMGVTVAASENNELVDSIDDLTQAQTQKELTTLQQRLQLDIFSSCDDMTSQLTDLIKERFADSPRAGGRYGGDDVEIMPTVSMEDTANEAADSVVMEKQAIGSSSTDISTTNLQVQGVDEADIIKTDGDHLYYYNQQESKIYILHSPLDRSKAVIDLEQATIVATINIPQTFNAVEMYLHDEQLVLVAQRRSEIERHELLSRNQKIDVVIYDISTLTKPKLLKLSDLDGSYHDSRIINDTLYIVSQLYVNRGYPWQVYKEVDDINIRPTDILPKTIDVAYTDIATQQNLRIGDADYPYHMRVERPNCTDVQYIIPNKESVDELHLLPNFSLVRAIDLSNTTKKPVTTASFGTTQTIHVSKDALYLTNPLYVGRSFVCPLQARCVLPRYNPGQHTLIHKFTLDADKVKYITSNLVAGTPLSQYSMSEDVKGNFRILTHASWSHPATHFFILDDTLDIEGMLMNIEPGEEFKASRYIGDKLYLVTFERTDPLFVIDLANTPSPKIIGELKIPGYSTYLHPYATASDGKQYLIGLGYATTENQRGGIVTDGLKIDLYEIDYTDTDEQGYVSTKQLYTQTRGEKNSASEALENPRMFVRDEKRKLLILPMILTKNEKSQSCNVQYDANGNEISRNCWDNDLSTTTFAGLKAITIDKDKGISEAHSYNFLERLLASDKMVDEEVAVRKEEGGTQSRTIWPRQFTQLHWRTGYLGDVLYTFNNAFAHFAVIDQELETYVDFEE